MGEMFAMLIGATLLTTSPDLHLHQTVAHNNVKPGIAGC